MSMLWTATDSLSGAVSKVSSSEFDVWGFVRRRFSEAGWRRERIGKRERRERGNGVRRMEDL